MVNTITHHLLAGYRTQTGIEATIFATRPAAGAQVLDIPD